MGKERMFQSLNAVNVGGSSYIADQEDAFAGTVSTDVVNLAKYDKALWIIQKGAGVTGTTVVTVESCDDLSASTATAIGFDYWTCTSGNTWSDKSTATSAGFTTTAGADLMYAVEINSSELYSTDQYARLKLTESADSPCDGAVICIMGAPRFNHEVPVDATA